MTTPLERAAQAAHDTRESAYEHPTFKWDDLKIPEGRAVWEAVAAATLRVLIADLDQVMDEYGEIIPQHYDRVIASYRLLPDQYDTPTRPSA